MTFLRPWLVTSAYLEKPANDVWGEVVLTLLPITREKLSFQKARGIASASGNEVFPETTSFTNLAE